MGFLETVYSLVFGDGDPNEGQDQRALQAVAALARRSGGVLTAEQMAPLLDPIAYKKSKDSTNVDESFVLSAVQRLNGRPEVSSSGNIVYVFDDLQTTAGEASQDEKPPAILKEREVPFSLAEDDQLGLAGLLGAFNLGGVAYLGTQFASISAAGFKLVGFLAFVQGIYPALIAYAIGFVAAPAIRYLGMESSNKEIAERNERREEWMNVLQSGEIDGKLAEARQYRQTMRQIGADDSVYSTGKSAAAQGTSNDLADFDKKLGGA